MFFNRATAAPKCIYIEGGVIKTSDGACGQTTNAGSPAVISEITTPTQSPPCQGGEIEGVATTSPEILPTATTTEPILTPVVDSSAITTGQAATTTPIIATTSEPVIVSTTTIETATTTP